MLDLSKLQEERTRWIGLPSFSGVELLVRYVGPEKMERFRNRLVSLGVCKKDEGLAWNEGRFLDWCKHVAKEFVIDWRGVKAGADDEVELPYDPEVGAKLLAGLHGAGRAVMQSLEDEGAFFSSNGTGHAT